ncbi:Mom family adenine methylcarbamoylation protein [Bradyrhizobium sp. AZCC 1699]|uniref:Mom family adenine methylcarbamoylation protein n=1 Tax=Bradyrhizobium sp. AZCC 1699 TaxID=3117024 RepID=UPI002FEF2677
MNRLAFSEALPRNSENRALSITLRMIRKHYPHIEWVISFADGCQCGDGTIYRAAGLVLTGIKLNKSLLRLPGGSVAHKMTQVTEKIRAKHFGKTGCSWTGQGDPLDGYQMRYIYFLNPDARAA